MKMKITTERLLNEEEVIERLRLGDRRNPKGALRWLMRVGKLPHISLGRGIVRFRAEDVDMLIANHYRAAS